MTEAPAPESMQASIIGILNGLIRKADEKARKPLDSGRANSLDHLEAAYAANFLRKQRAAYKLAASTRMGRGL